MTVRTVNLVSLKAVKNSIIGNPSAKLALAQDHKFVATLVECLNHYEDSQDSIRIEAAHVIASLSYGSPEALKSLLRFNAVQAFLYAISRFRPSDSVTLRSSFARGLRALAVAIAETVGPSQLGLRPEAPDARLLAKVALDYLFEVESLDIYLPLLIDTSPQTSASIAQLLAFAIRNSLHRTAITDWLPPAERSKEVKGKRGWENPVAINLNAPSRQGGWTARNLTALLRSRDSKLQDAALSALAALSKDNPSVSNVLAKAAADRDVPSPFSSVLSLTRSRSIDVQLAACLCATHILRSSMSRHMTTIEQTSALTIIHVINRMIAPSNEPPHIRTKACFILYHLVTDDAELCQTAFDHGILEKLANLVKSITPADNPPSWDDDEPESVSCLREAALTAIAAISLFDNDVRRDVTDNLRLLPTIRISMAHRHVGVRYAACQCVRALSRAVSVIRTNIVDSGLGMDVFQVFKKEDEDRRVTFAALSAICNIVNEFSPLRPAFLEKGLMPRLVQLLSSEDSTLRLNSLWAIKNLLRKTSTETKRDVMSHLGWSQLAALMTDSNEALQEQAYNIVRNLAEDDAGIDMVFRELGTEELLNHLSASLASKDEDVVLQATYLLANLANGCEAQQNQILAHPRLLTCLHSCLKDPRAEIRRPAVACVLELAGSNPRKRAALAEAGIPDALRSICDWNGAALVSPGGRIAASRSHSAEDDHNVVEQARAALVWLERGGEFLA